MFTSAYDPAGGLAVWVFSGATNTDADYARYLAVIGDLIAQCGGRSDLPAAVLVVDPGNPVPNAAWRKRIAEASKSVPSRALFAVVSESMLVRGAVTAINWIRPPPYEVAIHADFAAAARWIETRRGERLPVLAALLGKARGAAGGP